MDFDEYIDRNQYPTLKWSRAFLSEHFENKKAIPMSVADMDIKAPPIVIEHLQARVAHGVRYPKNIGSSEIAHTANNFNAL